jgi:two-component system cell cycle response regulator DivK
MRILYVEDDEFNFRLVERILTADGHEVVHARDGMAGLREAGAQRPDLVLMDLRLSDIDGFETARRMREVPSFAGTPIVAVTGWVSGDDEERAMREGFAGYIEKPFRLETLLTEVRRCSERRAGKQTPG